MRCSIWCSISCSAPFLLFKLLASVVYSSIDAVHCNVFARTCAKCASPEKRHKQGAAQTCNDNVEALMHPLPHSPDTAARKPGPRPSTAPDKVCTSADGHKSSTEMAQAAATPAQWVGGGNSHHAWPT
eukprot:1158814-Pelagomonas_calceolata.AAC.3